MTKPRSSDLLRQVGALFSAGTVTGLSDSQLLERFRSKSASAVEDTRTAEAAFDVLVARHGPMVLGVCRRALADPAEVEDAFQATFLVLVRRAGSVRVGDSLGRWLYGVSRRVAAKARARSHRARIRTIPLEVEPTAPETPADQSGLLAALDDEVSRLPEKYRAPVVLCHLEGLSHAEAADRLRWPVGTVSGRLSRARGLLKDRLVRRGLTPTENSLGMLLAADRVRAAVPEQLAAATARAAVRVSMGATSSAGAASASALTLANEVLRAAVAVKLTAVAAVVLALSLAGAVAVGGARAGKQTGDRIARRQPAVTTVPAPSRSGAHRPADEIVKEIDALLKTTKREVDSREKLDRLLQARSQIAALVEELWTAYPDDARLTRYLPERWECLAFSNRKADIYAETGAVLRTAKDRVLKKEALLFETGLRFVEPIDGRTAVSLAESFSRQAPDDNRAGELFRLAMAKLDEDWWLRAGLILLLALAGVFTLSAAWIRRVRLRVCLKLALGLGGLVSVLLAVLLITFQFLTYDRQNAIYGVFSGWRNLFSDPILQRKAGFIAFSLLYKVPEQLESIASSIRAGFTVAMALATALFMVVGHRRFAGGSTGWTSTIRLAVLGFVGVLAAAVGLDALLIAGQRGTVQDYIMREYPDVFKDRLADGQRRQQAGIGEPFELDFVDAITGRPVSMKALRGKVVVVDFWASYGGLLGGHIHTMKRLYAEYHVKGVEFIGVSLDQSEEYGGLEEFKAFVAKEQVPWPQFYEDLQPHRAGTRPGPTDRLLASIQHYSGVDSNRGVTRTAAREFSDSWGIRILPTVLLIDAEGKLYSTEAEGQLETLLRHVLEHTRNSSADR